MSRNRGRGISRRDVAANVLALEGNILHLQRRLSSLVTGKGARRTHRRQPHTRDQSHGAQKRTPPGKTLLALLSHSDLLFSTKHSLRGIRTTVRRPPI